MMNIVYKYAKLIKKLVQSPCRFFLDSRIVLYKSLGVLCFLHSKGFFHVNRFLSLKKIDYKGVCEAAYKCNGEKINANTNILIHLHIFYPEQVAYFIKKLHNVTCKFDLIVTMPIENKSIRRSINNFSHDAIILITPNRGYDIFPFICAIKHIDISKYDFVLKLHTKRKVTVPKVFNNTIYCGYDWRDSLVSSLIGSKKQFENIISLFSNNSEVGLISNFQLFRNLRHDIRRDYVTTQEGLKFFGDFDDNFCFVCGTMFIARAELFYQLAKIEFQPDLFMPTSKSNSGGTFAHVIERYFGAIAVKNNKILLGTAYYAFELKLLLKNRFFSKYTEYDTTYINLFFLTFSIKNLDKKVNKFIEDEKNIKKIENSKYFDEIFYVNSYGKYIYDKRITPHEHYFKYGWEKGFNPSEYFDSNEYILMNPSCTGNPLVDYIDSGCSKYIKFRRNNVFKQNADDSVRNEKKNKVVYTCIAGDNYSELIQHTYVEQDYDYICFTNANSMQGIKNIGIWKIINIEDFGLDNTRLNRFCKINPHIFLQDYEISLYVDANINIKTQYIFNIIKNCKNDILVPGHFLRDCIYVEATEVIKSRKDTSDSVQKTVKFLKNKKFPSHYGLTENNIIFRKHNLENIIQIMNDWWYIVKNYSKRDQLSFCYALWKNGIAVADVAIDNARANLVDFDFYRHVENTTFKSRSPENFYDIKLLFSKIKDSAIKVISFDLFDTLISRAILRPIDIFSIVEAYAFKISNGSIKNFSKMRLSAERACRKNSKYLEVTLDEIYSYIYSNFGISQETSNYLKNYEIELELKYTKRRNICRSMYNIAKKTNKIVVLCSDTYFDRSTIEYILDKENLNFDKCYISSEMRCRKADGTLFKKMLLDLNVRGDELLHIGDNNISDIDMALPYGITTCKINKSSDIVENNSLYKNVMQNVLESDAGYVEKSIYGIISQKMFDGYSHYKNKNTLFGASHYNLGFCALGPIVVSFVLWIMKQKEIYNFDIIMFLSREGKILQKVFDIFTEAKDNSEYLLTSRRAARVAALFTKDDVTSLALSPFQNGTKLSYLLRNRFGLKNESLTSIDYEKFGFSSSDEQLGTSLETTNKYLRLINFYSDIILENAKIERLYYKKYLSKYSCFNNIAVVDVGWQGHIQGALSIILEKKLTGLYYTAFTGAKLYESVGQTVRSYVGNFVGNRKNFTLSKHVTAVEYLMCDSSRSLLNFDSNGKPNFLSEICYDERKKMIELVHEGCVSFAKIFFNLHKDNIKNIAIDNMFSELIFKIFMEETAPMDAVLVHGKAFENCFDGVIEKKTHVR